ncbi:hypothetical protein K439DRAFT_1633120 [Ramaria rubella]|nr:hypothetical protein K439DRAFT_1633120 [Ramaria rubella]
MSHRHASPSGPWPFLDITDDIRLSNLNLSNPATTEPLQCPHPVGQCEGCWAAYPQSVFPNWTPFQVERSKMMLIPPKSDGCIIHRVDVDDNGNFSDPGSQFPKDEAAFWNEMQQWRRADNVRVRALFTDNLSEPVLQMLGTKYKIEPFFWSSSINWIPSRYQEDLRLNQGDHITITLIFPRLMKRDIQDKPPETAIHQAIDTQSPLPLRTNASTYDYVLVLDLLAIHMIRAIDSSTIISYQPTSNGRHVTSASSIHSRVYLAGQSIYWKNIFQRSNDPTFVLLTMLWYALYAWDQALEMLWKHICQLEVDVVTTSNIRFTQELHRVRAHLLHYASLLEDFQQTVSFVLDTPNPAMGLLSHDFEREFSRSLLEKECNNLSIQIKKLSSSRAMWEKRLANVMQLAFSSVNIEDSKHMQRLTEAAVRDSAAMKQVSYLTMVFLPASFVANVFGMNVKEIAPNTHGTLVQYVETVIPFSLVTMWLIVALQGKWDYVDEHGKKHHVTPWSRLSWPVMYFERWVARRRMRQQQMREKDVYLY